MHTNELIDKISGLQLPVFTDADVSELTMKDQDYTQLVLRRLAGRGMVKRIERGKYYLPNANIYAVASNIVLPSYISLSSAFRYYNLTTQTLVTMDVVVTRPRKPIADLEGLMLNFVSITKPRFFGYSRDRVTGAFMADIEKALIDSLYFRRPPYPYIEEALRAALEDRKASTEKLVLYARRMRSKTLSKRLDELLKEVQ